MRWATRCYSSSLTGLLQSRVRGGGLPCLTPLAGGVVTGQEGGSTSPDKRQVPSLSRLGRGRTWRIEKAVLSETTVTTAVLPWRAASNACVQPPARKARLPTQMRQLL